MSGLDHLIIVIFGVLVPGYALRGQLRGGGLAQRMSGREKATVYYVNSITLWGMATFVLAAWWYAGRGASELGLTWGRWPYETAPLVLLGVIVLLYLADLWSEVYSAQRRRRTHRDLRRRIPFLPSNAADFAHFIPLALAAGIAEEIVFRGYFINYAEWLFAGLSPGWATVATVVAPALAFAAAHFYQGWFAVVKVMALGTLFGLFFLWTGSLWPLMILHVFVDLVGGLLAWGLAVTAGEKRK